MSSTNNEPEDDDFQEDQVESHDFMKEQVRRAASLGDPLAEMLLALEASAETLYIPDEDEDLDCFEGKP